MGYIYLSIALLGGLLKGFSGKKASNFATNTFSDIVINTVRMFICTVIGLLVVVIMNKLPEMTITWDKFFIFLSSAISMSVFSVCFLFAYKSEAYMFICVFTMLGSMLTCVLSSFMFGENLGVRRITGIILLITSVYIMAKYNSKVKGNLSLKDFFILLAGGIGSGLADFCQKVFVHKIGGSSEIFNFYTYLFSFLLLILTLIILSFFNKTQEKECQNKNTVFLCLLMSLGLYINSTAKTFAAQILPSAQIYPALQGLNLIFSAIIVRIFFKEKLTISGILGLILAFIAILILNT